MFRLLWIGFLISCFSQLAIFGQEVDEEGLPILGIVGGFEVPIDYFPYMVSLQHNGGHRCGGSLISSKIVLTAGHCVVGINEEELAIRAGSANRENGGVVIPIKKYILHETYNSVYFDIAIILLESPMPINDRTISTIDLPEARQQIPVGSYANLTGWGDVAVGVSSPPHLQHVYMPIWDDKRCEQKMSSLKADTNFCAGGYEEGGIGACHSDSGGPLAHNGQVIGVVSFKIGGQCGEANTPQAYVHVANFRTWIDRTIQNLLY